MNKTNLSKIVLALILTIGVVVLFHTQSRADETQDLKNQVKDLQQKVAQLQQQLSNQPQPVVPTSAVVVKSLGQPSYDEWDPFVQMHMMQRQMDQLMKDNMADFNPKEDIKETPDAYIINIDIPGMQKDKINVEVKNKTLIISGVRDSEVKENGPDHFYRQERSFGNFIKTLPLPEDAKADSIDAQYNNGVLTVKIGRNKSSGNAATGQKIQVK